VSVFTQGLPFSDAVSTRISVQRQILGQLLDNKLRGRGSEQQWPSDHLPGATKENKETSNQYSLDLSGESNACKSEQLPIETTSSANSSYLDKSLREGSDMAMTIWLFPFT
jgi:hypothetical protein